MRGVWIALLATGAANSSPDTSDVRSSDVRAFRLSAPISRGTLLAARTATARGPDNPLRLARNTIEIATKTCWRYSSACQDIAFHPELVAQARLLMDLDELEPIFLKTTQIISCALPAMRSTRATPPAHYPDQQG